MSTEEAESVYKKSKLEIIKKDNLCALKCLSESMVAPFRLNPYVNNFSFQILKFSFNPEVRDNLFTRCLKTKPLYTDSNFRQYDKFKGQSIYYNSHGKDIDLYNFELNRELLDYLNNKITNIESLNPNNYPEHYITEYFNDGIQDKLTDNYLMDNEYYLQMPLDLGGLALIYNKIPRGGLNKMIDCRYISKDLNMLKELNYDSFPITLAIKLNYHPKVTKLRNSVINETTYGIPADLIDSLNRVISSIRLIKYEPDLNKHRLIDFKPLNLVNILSENIPNYINYSENDLTNEEVLNIISNSKFKKEFYNKIVNTNGSLYPGSYMHGVHHAHKTCLFSFVLATVLNLNEEEIDLLISASLLHDIGRTSDTESNDHGLIGAQKVNNLAIYLDNLEKKKILQFLIECHELDFEERVLISKLKKYGIKDTESVLKMLSVLKDSDALDRTRFTVYGSSNGALDPNYLINNLSHQLVVFAQNLNNTYESKCISKEENIIMEKPSLMLKKG